VTPANSVSLRATPMAFDPLLADRARNLIPPNVEMVNWGNIPH
jgi:hypothetical protein